VITVIQRVKYARVIVDDETVGEIQQGLLLFVGVEEGDSLQDADTTARKARTLRVFPAAKPTDLSVEDIGGSCLVVSQFTLAGELRHGNRPDFTQAAAPALAEPLYNRVASQLRDAGLQVAQGRFAASMQVELGNDGPITLILTVRDGKVVPRDLQG
jgi:D-aminoacyl-tRNA deacylase